MGASNAAPEPDARRRLQRKLEQWPRQRSLERRAWVFLGCGMVFWALLLFPASCLVAPADAWWFGFTMLFAPGPVFAWYSWRLARASVGGPDA